MSFHYHVRPCRGSHKRRRVSITKGVKRGFAGIGSGVLTGLADLAFMRPRKRGRNRW